MSSHTSATASSPNLVKSSFIANKISYLLTAANKNNNNSCPTTKNDNDQNELNNNFL